MSLHRKHDSGRKVSDVIYASSDLSLAVPKYKIPRDERSPRTAYALIHDELLLDGNSRQNLATFCTTWMEPEALTLMSECIDKNMIDKDEYPQTAEIESAMRPYPRRSLEFARRRQTPSAVPPPAPAKRRCSVVSRRNGAGEPSGARRANLLTSRIWFAGRCKYAGTSSASTSMSKSGRFRSKVTVF